MAMFLPALFPRETNSGSVKNSLRRCKVRDSAGIRKESNRKEFTSGLGLGEIQKSAMPTCVCITCGYSAPKKQGSPCAMVVCPQCGQLLRIGCCQEV
jgi:hypothetical protein